MRTEILAILTLAALILAVIVSISPHTTTLANEVTGEVYAVDIFGLTKDAKDPATQQYAAH